MCRVASRRKSANCDPFASSCPFSRPAIREIELVLRFLSSTAPHGQLEHNNNCDTYYTYIRSINNPSFDSITSPYIMHSILLILLGISLGAWSATVQPPPVIQTLSAAGSNGIGPEFQVTEKQDPVSEGNYASHSGHMRNCV